MGRLSDIFAENLRHYLSINGYSQADMARHMKVSSASASDWYHGVKTPRIEKIDGLCDWLNTDAPEFFTVKSKGGGEKMDLQISLAAARVNANLSQREASEMMGVSTNTLVNWESGRSEPTVSQGRRLSKLYNIPLDNIFLPEKSN